MQKIGRLKITTFAIMVLSMAITGQAAGAKPWLFAGKSDDAESKTEKNVQIKYTNKTKESHSWVQGRVVVKAPPFTVWSTVHAERQCDPDLAYCHLLSKSADESTYEEKFVLIPVVSSATVVLHDKEVPLQRIDYRLVKSDHFKCMEGSWVFTPTDEGRSTIVELTSYVDPGLPVPQSFIDNNLAKKIERRLSHVKLMAESPKAKLANAKVDQTRD